MRKVGIEHEFFVLSKQDAVPSKSMILKLFNLLRAYGFNEYIKKDNLTLSKDYCGGYVAISNDFCTHILEIAFPPVEELSEFEKMFKEVITVVDECLCKSDLYRLKASYLEVPDNEIIFVENSRFDFFNSRKSKKNKYYEQFPTTKIVSTQFDFNVNNSHIIYKNLNKLYSFEYFLTVFNNDKHCRLRHLIWRDSFEKEYFYNGFIDLDVLSYDDYLRKFNMHETVRDYSYVSPRNENRIEFRSSPSCNEINQILYFAKLRNCIIDIIEIGEEIPTVTSKEFFDYCEFKIVNHKKLNRLIAILEKYFVSCTSSTEIRRAN